MPVKHYFYLFSKYKALEFSAGCLLDKISDSYKMVTLNGLLRTRLTNFRAKSKSCPIRTDIPIMLMAAMGRAKSQDYIVAFTMPPNVALP